MKLNEFYRSLFQDSFIRVDENNDLYSCMGEDDPKSRTFLMLDGKRMRLSGINAPRGDWSLINPMREFVGAPVAASVEKLTTLHAQALHFKIQLLMTAIFNHAASKVTTAKNDLSEIMRLVPVTATDLSTWTKIVSLSNNPNDASYRFISFRQRPQIRKDGQTYPFGTVVTFPLYDKLKTSTNRRLGNFDVTVKMSKMIVALMRYIFPDIDTEAYSFPGTVRIAPRYSSTVSAMAYVALRLNELVEFLDGVTMDDDLIRSDLQWYEDFQTFDDTLSNEIRLWTKEDDVKVAQAPVVATAAPSRESINSTMQALANRDNPRPSMSHATPTVNPQTPPPQSAPAANTVSYEEFMRSRNGGYTPPVNNNQSLNIVHDAQGRAYIVQPNGQAVPVSGQPAPMPQQPQMRPAPVMNPQVPQGTSCIMTDPSTGRRWYADARGGFLGYEGAQMQPIQQPSRFFPPMTPAYPPAAAMGFQPGYPQQGYGTNAPMGMYPNVGMGMGAPMGVSQNQGF